MFHLAESTQQTEHVVRYAFQLSDLVYGCAADGEGAKERGKKMNRGGNRQCGTGGIAAIFLFSCRLFLNMW